MADKDFITINGQKYDPVTGLPIEETSKQPEQHHETTTVHHTTASHLHSAPQRSLTLHRKAIKKPTHKIVHHHSHAASHATDTVKHPDVRRFAPHPVGAISPKKVMDIGPAVHPHVAKAHALSAAKAEQALTSQFKPASETKREAVHAAVQQTHKRKPLRQRIQPRQRVVGVLTAVLALMMLGGYVTYLNMPALSVRIAASQAGINANYPDYRPDGYSLAGPVSYGDGKVSMNFKANGGDQTFTISQSKSEWNNEAVLDNYVTPRAGSNYVPYTEHGLTIYTFDNDAAWVNGGVLYTIQGDAPLSSEQIRHIATSLL